MASDKDRLGNKLREAERGREDQYFAERDRKLIEQLRDAKGGESETVLKQAALMRCPKCGAKLESHTLHGVSVDECPSCHGVWLDAGELDHLGKTENAGWIARWLRSEFRREPG